MTTTTLPGTLESVLMELSMPLRGDLAIPRGATSLIIFAHGSGSSRRSPRNRWVAEKLQEAGFATLLFDLLSEAEDALPHLRFEIPTLAERLVEATEWTARHPGCRDLRLGYFGASTGAAAALLAAADRPELIRAVVSRGGRPDLAAGRLGSVVAPTRLIVGEHDSDVIQLNRFALQRIGTNTKDLVIVPGATHLFEEPGTLARAAELAVDWFQRYVSADPIIAMDDEC